MQFKKLRERERTRQKRENAFYVIKSHIEKKIQQQNKRV